MAKENVAKKSTDEVVLELLRKVMKQKAEVQAGAKKPTWHTNCTIGYNPDSVSDRVNIMTVTSPAKLAEIYAFLLQKEEYLSRVATALGLVVETDSYMGHTIENWKKDLTTRAGQLVIDKKKKELDALEKRLDSLVTLEQRRDMELEEIQRQMGL